MYFPKLTFFEINQSAQKVKLENKFSDFKYLKN